jgi:hypothetical protein
MRQFAVAKRRFGSEATGLRWSRDVRFYPVSDQIAALQHWTLRVKRTLAAQQTVASFDYFVGARKHGRWQYDD